MNWLKKNVFLALGAVIALGLLGFAIFFLITNKQAVDQVTADLNAKTTEWNELVTRDPYPNQENINEAKKEQTKVGDFLKECRKYFVPVADYTNMDGATFKDLLETTIADMERDAEKSGVSLPNAPSKYDFTFKPQRGSLDFAPETLVPMATQVAEIKAICDVLFDARVHALTGLRRLPVAKQDVEATDYLVGKKPTTNTVTGAVLAPYEIQFQGFTTELAAVVEGFYRSSNCFIVRNIDVQTNVVNVASETARPLPSFMPIPNVPATEVPQMSPGELMRRRYGFGPGGRYGPSAPVAPAPAPTPGVFVPPAHKGPVTVLDERPFKTTMYVEAVRLIERARPKSGK